MKPLVRERIHTLEIPIGQLSLLVPSASVAEVITTASTLAPLPGAPAWVVGVLGWRLHAVPVLSFEALTGGNVARPSSASKIVVFYPLSGRNEWEFFGVLTQAEPRPQPIDVGVAIAAAPSELPETPYIAAGLKAEGRLMAIPDFEALKSALYP